jgi:hypothetical protein
METMMYLKVHTLADANLHWSSVEAHKAPQMQWRPIVLLLSLPPPPPKMEDPIHYGTLEGAHRTHTSLGKSPQLNWRFPINPQCLRHTPQLNWRLPRIITKAPQSQKSTKLG